MWWSPDSTHIAYLRLDETEVPEFYLQLYTDRNASYPKQQNIKYPKAGAPNPLVSLHIYSLESNTTIVATTTDELNSVSIMDTKDFTDFDQEDRLIIDVTWASDSHSHLLFKQTNRIQDHQLTNIVNINSKDIKKSTVRLVEEYKPTDGGWIDVSQSMVYLPSTKSSDSTRYLDILDSADGYPHLAVVTVDKDGSEINWLTSGEWEVVSGTVEVDEKRQLVYVLHVTKNIHLLTLFFFCIYIVILHLLKGHLLNAICILFLSMLALLLLPRSVSLVLSILKSMLTIPLHFLPNQDTIF